ncbi:hypothetical protein [Deinococcus aquiradiocola]|uniref:Uncharacterized protein n=1 Tax=Deinococcus aquiradiocola TaxID=393059 RepID=A0A917P4S4_9DEIO|nr:hypothetical protein [Deinococcus aquiradiocola]GGJ61716.1 hypothetical protein GCM10008939_01830 [Deinococcus aquiradiocola]
MTGPDHPAERDETQPALDVTTRARLRAEETERLRLRTELEDERRRKQISRENRGCLGAINLVLKILGW